MSHGVFGTLDGVYTLEYNDVPPEMRFEKPCVFELCAVAEDQGLADRDAVLTARRGAGHGAGIGVVSADSGILNEQRHSTSW